MDSGDEPTPGIITETVGSYTDEAGNKVGITLSWIRSCKLEITRFGSVQPVASRTMGLPWLDVTSVTTGNFLNTPFSLSWSESGYWSCLSQVSLVMRRYQFRAFRKPRLVLYQMYGEETGKASIQKCYFRVQQKCTQGLYLDKTATFHPKQRRK